jgi:hypothetical protein
MKIFYFIALFVAVVFVGAKVDWAIVKLNHIEKTALQTQLLLEDFNQKSHPTLQEGGIVLLPDGSMFKFSTFSNTWLEVKQGFTAANSSTNSTGWHTPCGGSFSPFK